MNIIEDMAVSTRERDHAQSRGRHFLCTTVAIERVLVRIAAKENKNVASAALPTICPITRIQVDTPISIDAKGARLETNVIQS